VIKSNCEVCGTEVLSYPSRPRRYCTKRCYGQASLRTADTFWGRVSVGAEGHCWDWQGSRSARTPNGGGGYGTLKWNRRYWYAHHVAYALTHGPIPEGAFVLHHCDDRVCCNPDHLYIGTHQNNMDDMKRRGRSKGAPRKVIWV